MAYYIDKGSIRIEPTQDPSIFQVTADVTTDKTGNDWEKEWTTVTCKVNKNETGSLAKYIEKAYKAKKEIPEQTAIDTLLSRLSQEKTVRGLSATLMRYFSVASLYYFPKGTYFLKVKLLLFVVFLFLPGTESSVYYDWTNKNEIMN